MRVQTGKPYEKSFTHSAGVIALGPFLFTSGITGRLPDGRLAGEGMREQAQQVVENLKDVFAAAGTDCSQIVKITIFVTDIDEYVAVQDACADLLSAAPASTLVEVSRLALPAMKIEIEATVKITS